MADTKISALTEMDATPDDADLLPIVDDPGGTPATKKITVTNLLGAVPRVLEQLSPSTVSQLDVPLAAGYEFHEVYVWLDLSADDQVEARFSNDGGSTFREGVSDYSWVAHRSFASGSDGVDGDEADDSIVITGTDAGDGEGFHARFVVSGARDASILTGLHGDLRRKTSLETHERFAGRVLTAEANDALRIFCGTATFTGKVRVVGIP